MLPSVNNKAFLIDWLIELSTMVGALFNSQLEHWFNLLEPCFPLMTGLKRFFKHQKSTEPLKGHVGEIFYVVRTTY